VPELALVIKGAMVFDGTGAPGRRLDVGIEGDRIALVGPNLSGASVLEADGLAAAPGFIDTHSHSDLKVFASPGLEPKLRQGITLELFGQDGISVAPLRKEDVQTRRRQLAGLLTDPDVDWSWRSVRDYLSALERARPAPDVAYLVPHGAVRESVMGLEDRPASDLELEAMRALLKQGLTEGAFGLSTGLIYPPCCYGDSRELVGLCEVVAERGGAIAVHLRSESDRLLEAIDEMVEVSRSSGVRLHLSHLKIAGRTNWPKVDQVIAALGAAAESGIRLTADQYPYLAGSTLMGAILPPWVHSGGSAAVLRRLESAADRAKIQAQIRDPADVPWDNFWKWSGPEGIIIADIPSGNRPELVGKSLAQAGEATGQDPVELALDLLRQEQLGVAMISFSQSEQVLGRFLKLPFVNACTDGLLGGRPHPRAYGTYPRILGRYVREKKMLKLEEAVRKVSGLAADAFGFQDHGYLLPGKRANVVLFDPTTVMDTATYDEPAQFPVGIHHVLVGGQMVIRDGEATGVRPGTVLRQGARA
jgi:N-acyl-D-amino-acid deacylase